MRTVGNPDTRSEPREALTMRRDALPQQASPHLGFDRLLQAQPGPRPSTGAPERDITLETTRATPSARVGLRPLGARPWQLACPFIEFDGSDDTVGTGWGVLRAAGGRCDPTLSSGRPSGHRRAPHPAPPKMTE
jgi:hypothetical protein